MTDLIIQHPELGDAAVRSFAEAVGRSPDRREPALAAWRGVRIDRERAARLADEQAVDAGLVPQGATLADYRIAAFDMDSTLITIECVDEIADFVGRKAEVAAITEAAMRGEIADYDESLRRRVALLEGLPEETLQKVWDERVRLTPGAERLVAQLKAAGLKILLVSGGFTFFTDRLKARLGIDFTRSNTLEIAGGRLTGGLVGKIVNASGKRQALEDACARIGCPTAQAIAVGDGANDLEMMGIAGVSVAYRAKPVVREKTTFAINHNGLDALLGWLPPAS
ncbi:phosphoserine phosphatase SerB [Burkholderiaceae bacterium FT117]|uniref:phosphoserine phosphatase SerB n=1 Tax=Zeimonas sediminis TaxID=2944268 RepID=UPI002342DF53|nr:phosphoserine phosphatase SerB [Zeimonas sediminis]MCM5569127.1 phosphoserine phosphatase SerB [Zeimonas sediminis]